MLKAEKERIVTELAERLKSTQTLFVADYRGLSVTEIDDLRTKLIEHGARFTVVKNTLTRRAAEAAGADALLALLEGPTAIAFIEADGDMVAVAKALADSARDHPGAGDPGRDSRRIADRRGRRQEPGDAAAARRSSRPGDRCDHRTADDGGRADLRTGARPGRPDRRADRAARGSADAESPEAGRAGAEPEAESEAAASETAAEEPATEEPEEPASAQAEPERTDTEEE